MQVGIGPKTKTNLKESTKTGRPSFAFGVLKLDKVMKGGRIFKPKPVIEKAGVSTNSSPTVPKPRLKRHHRDSSEGTFNGQTKEHFKEVPQGTNVTEKNDNSVSNGAKKEGVQHTKVQAAMTST